MDRRRFEGDPHRPRYHFLPPANWMNDPNGLIQHQGLYHLFYQHNPAEPVWGPMHWGHAVSRDLVRWEDWPIALAPTPGGPDADGCWSGYAVVDADAGGVPTLIYSGNRDGRQLPCLATSADGMRTWEKHPGNPVIAAPPAGLDLTAFRDHSVWREGGAWRQVIGAGVRGVGGAALLYGSPDLRAWEYLGPILTGAAAETGEIWECPDLFPLDGRHVLIVSPIPLRKAIYFVGAFDGRRLTPSRRADVDVGGHLYAPQTFRDERGRRLLFGWLWEGRDEAAQRAAGWAGVMSLPRVLSLAGGGLRQEPAPELATLRGAHSRLADVPLAAGRAVALPLPGGAAGDAVEIDVAIDIGDAAQLELAVRRSPGGEEETRIIFDRAGGRLEIDRSRASLDETAGREPHGGAWEPPEDGLLRARVFVDRSVVEVFGGGTCAATRIYPSRADSGGLAITARGGAARLVSADVWQLGDVF